MGFAMKPFVRIQSTEESWLWVPIADIASIESTPSPDCEYSRDVRVTMRNGQVYAIDEDAFADMMDEIGAEIIPASGLQRCIMYHFDGKEDHINRYSIVAWKVLAHGNGPCTPLFARSDWEYSGYDFSNPSFAFEREDGTIETEDGFIYTN